MVSNCFAFSAWRFFTIFSCPVGAPVNWFPDSRYLMTAVIRAGIKYISTYTSFCSLIKGYIRSCCSSPSRSWCNCCPYIRLFYRELLIQIKKSIANRALKGDLKLIIFLKIFGVFLVSKLFVKLISKTKPPRINPWRLFNITLMTLINVE